MDLSGLQAIFSAAPVFEQFPGDGDVMLFRMELSDPEVPGKLRDRLSANGFSQVFENKFSALSFTVWSNGSQMLYVATDADLRMRVTATDELWEPLPESGDSFRPVADPLVTQPRGLFCTSDCGMVYLIRLSDGRFVLVDSGLGEYEETAHLFELIREQNVLPGNPVIAAWFITHRHSDHFRGFEQFMDRYADKVVLERLIYNWPAANMIRSASPSDGFDRIAASLPAGTVITAHAGQQFRFADAVFDVLFACEDLYPAYIRNLNDTSTVLRMALGTHRAMWLGDAQHQCANLLCERYTAEDLAADVLQVAHHGYWGGSAELYRRIDPAILLWPCPDYWYHEAVFWNENRPLVTSRKVRETYLSGNEEVTLNFADTDLTGRHAMPVFEPPVILHETFAGTEVRDLYWACVSGGQTGYVPPRIDNSLPGEARLTAGNALGVVTLLRQGLLDLPEGFTLLMEGRFGVIGDESAVGMLWNDPHPTVPNSEKILRLPAKSETAFSFRFSADPQAGVARLWNGGCLLREISYEPQKNCGLHLILKNAEAVLRNILVVEGCSGNDPDCNSKHNDCEYIQMKKGGTKK